MPRKKKTEEPVVNEAPKKKPGRPKKSDTAVAAEIEVKKTVRKAERDAKEAIEETAAVVKDAVEEQAVATEIEVKKTVRKAGRKAKEAVEDTVKQAATSDAVVANEIEVKKTVRKAGRKAKEAADDVAKETKRAVKKATLDIIIESPMGGAISTDEIAKRVPKGTEAVYVRVDENKIYWVKGKKTGDIDIWE